MRQRLRTVLLALALLLPFVWRLDAEEFHGDESHWITSGQQAAYLVWSGQWRSEQWREEFYLYSQPQVGKLLIGAALAAAGYRGPQRIYDYDWQRKPGENRAAGRVPPDGAILAARLPGAFAGWLTCLLLWAFAAALGSAGTGRVAAALLASHPLWLANARRAGLDASALCLGLLAAWAGARALTRRTGPALVGSALAGAALGLAAGAKYVGLLAALAGVAAAPARLRRRPAAPPWGAALAAVAGATTAVVVFVAANPTLYRDPILQMRVSVGFLTGQADDMRRQVALFASPVLVAAEIVDRTVWPTGFPRVVDESLPVELIPGSYGTPLVALGAAIGVVLLPRARGTERRVRAAALLWTAAVFGLLALSLSTWWERWHLPLVPPLCLLAGAGLAGLDSLGPRRNPVSFGALLAGAQCVAALAMGPSYLGKGFGALLSTPVGTLAHLGTLGVTLVVLLANRPSRYACAATPHSAARPIQPSRRHP